MGYSTDFDGQVTVTPPLNAHEIAYLKQFSESRRMLRVSGPYGVDGEGFAGQDITADVRDNNSPPAEQPSLWCGWEPSEEGDAIRWNGAEKFHDGDEWMRYLISTFLCPQATVQGELANPVPGRAYPPEFSHFTFDHEVNGVIDAQGEDPEDRWCLVVTANVVTVQKARIVWDSDEDEG